MKVFFGVLGVLALIALGIGLFILSVWMVVWNVNDIYNNGLNFWNAFWLMLVASSGIIAVKAS